MKFKIKRLIAILLSSIMLVMSPVSGYMQVQAAEVVVVVGGVALKELLIKLLVTAGVTAIGVTTVRQLEKDSEQYKNLEAMILSDTKVSNAVNDISTFKASNSNLALKDVDFTSAHGFRVIHGGKNDDDNNNNDNKLNFVLSAGLVSAAANAARKWAESADNDLVIAEGEDLSGTESVDYEYMSSIKTTVKMLPTVQSMQEIDDYFGVPGAYDYLKSLGYSDEQYYFLVNPSGSYTYISPIPLNYSVVGYRVAWLGSTGTKVISNLNYKNAVIQCGVRDASAFSSYFSNLPSYSGKTISYYHYKETFSVSDRVNVPGYDYLRDYYPITNWYLVNYQDAYLDGASVNYTYFTTAMERIIYSYKTVRKNLRYDLSLAPNYDDGFTFSVGESDFDGFEWSDYADLLKYISSLSAQLENWHEDNIQNQEEIIQQNKNILDGINTLTRIITGIGNDIGSLVGSVGDILSEIKMLPQNIAAELGDISVSLPDDFADAVADAVALALPEAMPWTDEVIDSLVSLPQLITDSFENLVISVPEIEIPPIEIPDVFVDAPVINLDPSYNITVDNDYTGLEDIISAAVTGVLTDLFVPDTDATLAKVDSMRSYFDFADDIKLAVGDFKDFLFGIVPSPILKIPIGQPTSQKYDYGFGDYFIVDISWYAAYKQYGDKIILAILWGLFLWRLFIKLPGIVSGAEGSIVAADKSYNKYISKNQKGN